MNFPTSHQPRWCEQQSCTAINYLSNGINILAEDHPIAPVPVNRGPKCTDPQ